MFSQISSAPHFAPGHAILTPKDVRAHVLDEKDASIISVIRCYVRHYYLKMTRH